MDKIAFILGAGAHKPFDFPDGNTLKSQIAEQLQHASQRSPQNVKLNDAYTSIQNCGVSIDRFLNENKDANLLIRPLIAYCLLAQEKQVRKNPVITDWLQYIWQFLTTPGSRAFTTRFTFITFNYDRSLEYLLARACSTLCR
jgi:hypothetical protein